MKNPELNDCCNVNYDGRDCIATVISMNITKKTFDVFTFFGQYMRNIPFDKFRFNPTETILFNEFDTIGKIIKQIEACNYENEAGSLKNNIAFMALKRMA